MALSVLVVDDSLMSRKLTVRALPAQWNAQIIQAADGREALAVLRERTVDVVLLDLTMPEMDGYQVLEALAQERVNCCVIVVSADVQPQAEQRARALGARGFLRKPVYAEDVRRVARQLGLL